MNEKLLENCKIGDKVIVLNKIPFIKTCINGTIIDKKVKESIRVFEDVTNYCLKIKLENGKIIKVKDNDSSTFLDIYKFKYPNAQ